MNDIVIEKLIAYSNQDAADLGQLMTSLSTSTDGKPVDRQLLLDIINSPWHDMIVARLGGKIVGAATLSLLLGPVAKRIAYLEDFVTDQTVQGQDIGSQLWDAMLEWCRKKGARRLEFTSNPARQAAHQFYLKRGAVTYDTTVFHKEI